MIAESRWFLGISFVWIDLPIVRHLARMVRMDRLSFAEHFLQK
ncbi:hypothetical protein CU025_0390 [Enterococcus faecium]|nr:hypothetical protein [Enterococcus faecium]MBK4765831.1 hypothetical protein [Enterococcus faecium]MBK4810825.1 hypothetical protein [Enterococcus faecium]MBK4821731.1 hypothetical protein [Enterococcus faecium]